MKQFLFSRYTMPRTNSRLSDKKPTRNVPSTKFQNPYSSVATTAAPPPALPSFGQTMKEGFSLGVGSAIAHRVVGAIFGAPTVNVSQTSTPIAHPCDKERFAFESCMKTQSMDTFCGQEQIAYTDCIHMTKPTSGQ
jgi:hypothetical protein